MTTSEQLLGAVDGIPPRMLPLRERAILETIMRYHPDVCPYAELGGNGSATREYVMRLRGRGWDIRTVPGRGYYMGTGEES